MNAEEKLRLLEMDQRLSDETIEISHQLIEISKHYSREFDVQMAMEHIEYLKRRKESIQKLYEEIKKEMK